MPKNKKAQKNNKNSQNISDIQKKRALVFKEDMEEYAQVSKMLGDLRILVILPDKSEVMANIPGRFRKRCWMTTGTVVLVSKRTFEDKYDVCHKYNDEEVRKLVEYFEIPSFFLDYNETGFTNSKESNVDFVNIDSDSENMIENIDISDI
jgi:translation initiation factor 1A